MKLKKQNNVELLSDSMVQFFNIQDYKDILQFALQDVDLSDDVSASKSKVDLQNYPYLVQPLSNCSIEYGIRKQICVAFPQQMGKTMLQMIAILYNTVYNNLQAIICYPSLDLAVETSTVKFIPLFKKIKQFEQEIEKPFAIRSDRLKLSNAIIYWQGAGTKVVSKSSKLVLGDECAVWDTPHEINNINELKKRTRSYNECLQLFVSTPHYKQDYFWREWLNGSQAFYYLRCCNCGQLTMRSADIHNLQFQTVYNQELKQYVAVRGSQRLICPNCKYEHEQKFKEQLIKQGKYIHKFEDRKKEYPTYQAGVLASLLNVHSWSNIADIQLSSGKQATLQDYISFDNSIRGLPYQERDYNKQDETALSKHFYKPGEIPVDQLEALYIVADTQDTFSPYGVFALDTADNIWCIRLGRLRYLWLEDEERKIIDAENKRNGKQPQTTLLDLLDKQWFGLKPLCLMVDMRGHRTQEIKNFSKMRKNIIMYGGTNLKYDKFKPSQNIHKLFLCDAKSYTAKLIFNLYFQQNRQANYIYLPQNITEQDLAQITSFQPDNTKRNGNLYQNWTPGDKIHDMADVLRMCYCAVDISAKIFRKQRFRFGKAKILNPPTINKQPIVKHKQAVKTIKRNPLFRH